MFGSVDDEAVGFVDSALVAVDRDIPQHQPVSLTRIATQAATSRALTRGRMSAFVDLVRQKIETADIQARKTNLQAVASKIRVDDHKIQIIGDKASMAAVIAGQQTASGKVSGFVRNWCTMRNKDTNLYVVEIYV